jgi:hypothetical protein
MAGQGYKLFVNGNTLSASDLNTYLNQQTVMVFASTGARTTALSGVLAEGMVSYITGTGLQYYTGSAWVNFDHTFSGSSSGSTVLQASATASGTLTLPAATDTLIGRATTDTLTNKTLTSAAINTSTVKSPREITTISATAATGTINFDANTQGTLYYTTNASANFTINVRGDSGTTLNSVMAVGDSLTVVFLNTNGATPYYASDFTIDGNAITPKWQTGTAPSAGNASSIDAYSYAIFKTGSAAFTVFASQTKFA